MVQLDLFLQITTEWKAVSYQLAIPQTQVFAVVRTSNSAAAAQRKPQAKGEGDRRLGAPLSGSEQLSLL